MIIKKISVGMIEENCYVVKDEESKEIAVIDPGDEGNEIINLIEDLGGTLKYILLTHGHYDHVGAVNCLSEKYGIKAYINENDYKYMIKRDRLFFIQSCDCLEPKLKDGNDFTLGNTHIKCIETPGHSEGGVSFIVGDNVFVGDTLFYNSVGRTDFVGGDFKTLVKSINDKLINLGDNVVVYPGHGGSTTIGYERQWNPYIRNEFPV
jgi:glyoxylase-like metal-dependent hydrolase (beta-lactamase superfamily II)